eukprot:scaffold3627_cov350-Prasinococcus_capsulatus_cf.AAC.4
MSAKRSSPSITSSSKSPVLVRASMPAGSKLDMSSSVVHRANGGRAMFSRWGMPSMSLLEVVTAHKTPVRVLDDASPEHGWVCKRVPLGKMEPSIWLRSSSVGMRSTGLSSFSSSSPASELVAYSGNPAGLIPTFCCCSPAGTYTPAGGIEAIVDMPAGALLKSIGWPGVPLANCGAPKVAQVAVCLHVGSWLPIGRVNWSTGSGHTASDRLAQVEAARQGDRHTAGLEEASVLLSPVLKPGLDLFPLDEHPGAPAGLAMVETVYNRLALFCKQQPQSTQARQALRTEVRSHAGGRVARPSTSSMLSSVGWKRNPWTLFGTCTGRMAGISYVSSLDAAAADEGGHCGGGDEGVSSSAERSAGPVCSASGRAALALPARTPATLRLATGWEGDGVGSEHV